MKFTQAFITAFLAGLAAARALPDANLDGQVDTPLEWYPEDFAMKTLDLDPEDFKYDLDTPIDLDPEHQWFSNMTHEAHVPHEFAARFFKWDCLSKPELKAAYEQARNNGFKPEGREKLDSMVADCFNEHNPLHAICLGLSLPAKQCDDFVGVCSFDYLKREYLRSEGVWGLVNHLRECAADPIISN